MPVEFIEKGGAIRLLVRRQGVAPDPAAGHGMVRVPAKAAGSGPGKLSDFDTAMLLSTDRVRLPVFNARGGLVVAADPLSNQAMLRALDQDI